MDRKQTKIMTGQQPVCKARQARPNTTRSKCSLAW